MCNLKSLKNYPCLIANNIHDKTSQKVKTDEFLKVRSAQLLICTRVTTLYSCYMRMQPFSVNQKRDIFSCT